MSDSFSYYPLGDAAFIIKVGEGISYENHIKVRAILESISELNNKFIKECIPSHNEVLVQYDPVKSSYSEILQLLKLQAKNLKEIKPKKKNVVKNKFCRTP